jgi:hypothetical protein
LQAKELLREIFELGLPGMFPNITIALPISTGLPASVASTKGQNPLNGFASLDISCGRT